MICESQQIIAAGQVLGAYLFQSHKVSIKAQVTKY